MARDKEVIPAVQHELLLYIHENDMLSLLLRYPNVI
jgi:hypothetical protein